MVIGGLSNVLQPGCCVMLGVRAVVGNPYLNEINPGQQTVDIGGGVMQEFSAIKKAPVGPNGEICHR